MNCDTLCAGSLIGIVAPAGPAEPAAVDAVAGLFAARGYRSRFFPGCRAPAPAAFDYLAGSDDERLADLHAAVADPEVAAIHCLRGGYGAMRLLDRIDTALVRANPKLLIGYSDITALQALWCREGLPTLHAPMPASDLIQPGREADADALFALLREGLRAGDVIAPDVDRCWRDAGLHHDGVAEGLLVGGNLSLVAALTGTPYAWPVDGAVLFVEDVNEAVYRVDRLLTQLRLAGVFDRIAGVVLGRFTDAGDPLPLLVDRLLPLCRARDLPLLAGWPTGHGTPNRPLPMGLRVRLDAGAATLTLRQTLIG